jgi:tryptophan synthase alpha chain
MRNAEKLKSVFSDKEQVLSVFFTAGFPRLDDFKTILKSLQSAGADLIEIGMPFSDPIADGPTIQYSNQVSIKNGFTLDWMFEELKTIQHEFHVPFLLMGYLNPVIQYGLESFIEQARDVGASGIIIPDLPMYEYEKSVRVLLEKNGLTNVFLITPQTTEERIHQIDELSDSFIYMVATAGTTGARMGISRDQEQYFERIRSLQLNNPVLGGFGIADKDAFEVVCRYVRGAIIGSAFIKLLNESENITESVNQYIQSLR